MTTVPCMQDIWRDSEVVADWKDAEVVPVLKKGDLQNYDNWWDISLLDVVTASDNSQAYNHGDAYKLHKASEHLK